MGGDVQLETSVCESTAHCVMTTLVLADLPNMYMDMCLAVTNKLPIPWNRRAHLCSILINKSFAMDPEVSSCHHKIPELDTT